MQLVQELRLVCVFELIRRAPCETYDFPEDDRKFDLAPHKWFEGHGSNVHLIYYSHGMAQVYTFPDLYVVQHDLSVQVYDESIV